MLLERSSVLWQCKKLLHFESPAIRPIRSNSEIVHKNAPNYLKARTNINMKSNYNADDALPACCKEQQPALQQQHQQHRQTHRQKGKFCSGVRQSPIDLVTQSVSYMKQQGMYWGKGFYDEPLTQELKSDNHTIVITSTFTQTPYVSGGPLSDCYKLHSIHFHWGQVNSRGSEHTLNGNSYPMEMHVVCTKGNLTMDEAKAEEDGITVLGYFIDILPDYLEKRKPRNPFSIMTKTIDRLQFVETPKEMLTKFAIGNLAIPFHFNYLTYQGSLTTGDCNEVVTWIISPNVLKISRQQIAIFRNLYPKKLVDVASNYREVQPLNGRTVSFVKGRRSFFDKGY